jgi:Ca2+-binding RTX toxin-like protein
MGQEFTVNFYEAAWQDEPQLLTFRDGSFLIAWRSFFSDQDTYAVQAQYYDQFGRPVLGERTLDGIDGSASEIKAMTQLADGGFVITFSFSFDGLLDQDETYAKIFNADFSVRKDAFRVDNLPTFQTLGSTVAPLADGGFIVSFGYDGVDTEALKLDFDDIYAQRYDANGNAIGGNFRLNTNVKEFDQNAPESVQLKNGNTLIIWHSEASYDTPGDLDSNEIRGTILSGNGTVLRSDFSIADAEGSVGDGIDPYNMCALKNGGFALVRYETEMRVSNEFTYEVKLRLFNGSGTPSSNEITVAKGARGIIYDMDVTQLTTGEIVVVWETPSPTDYPYNDVLAKIYSSTGRPLTGEFNVAQRTDLGQEQCKVEALANGGFVVAFMSEQADVDHDGIAARVFKLGPGGDIIVPVLPILNEKLVGTTKTDYLLGGDGNDRLIGNSGNDVLTGGFGLDKFVFNKTLNAKTNVDVITDFEHGLDDIVLKKSIFSAVGPTLAKSEFYVGSKAHDANDRIVYQKKTGDLFYDSNGSGAGGKVKFAHVEAGTILTFDDFLLV